MKHWQETAEILSQVAAEAAAGRRAAVATVVRISGSAYRRPGARFLVRDDGSTTGGVSGGCLEADVREHAMAVLREGNPRVLHYDTASDDRTVFGLGLGCNGAVDVFLQPATTRPFLEEAARIRRALDGDEPVAILTVLDGAAAGRVRLVARSPERAPVPVTGVPELDRALADAGERLREGDTRLHDLGSARVLVEVLAPPPHVVLFGAGDDAIPLARFAREAGFRVALVDHRPAFLAPARFPGDVRRVQLRPEDGVAAAVPTPVRPRAREERRTAGGRTYAVVKTHSLAHDREWIRGLLATDVAYVGVLGPRARIDEILRQLGATADARIFGPVGLDLGADGPEQVALAIVAELLAVHAGRRPAHLRDREGPIHAG